jgi:hypothetical protein
MRVSALRFPVLVLVGVLALTAGVPAGQALTAPVGLQDLSGSHSVPLLAVKFECKLVQGKLVCGKDIDNDVGADDNKPEKKKKTGNICAGEVSCPAGYVVLDKPNKYGACCEPVDASKSAPKPAPAPAAEKCKFPGEVGTPPNCHCPADTEFYGYQGCMKTCCGTPSKDPKYSKVYVQCAENSKKAYPLAVALAKANGDPSNNVTCVLTKP